MTRIHDGGTDWWGPGSIRSGQYRPGNRGMHPAQGARPRRRRAVRGAGRRVVRITDIAFRAGANTNIEVIDAQRRARDAETGVAIAEHVLRRARLELLVATGQFPR